jgi:hypothetical protein
LELLIPKKIKLVADGPKSKDTSFFLELLANEQPIVYHEFLIIVNLWLAYFLPK